MLIKILLALFLLCFTGCTLRQRELGEVVTKKLKYEEGKLKLIVLAKSEYDTKGNIIRKATGDYVDIAGRPDFFTRIVKGKREFRPALRDTYDIYYQHDYDENGNLIHTFIRNTKDETTLEYSFDYDDSGKIVHCKNSDGGEHWYEYDSYGNMTYQKSYYYNEYDRLLGIDGYIHTYFKHEYEDGFVTTKIKSNGDIFLLDSFAFIRNYSALGFERIKSLVVNIGDDQKMRIINQEPCVNYRYGKKINTEYYTNYKRLIPGYATYFGKDGQPVGVDGKIYFDSHEGLNSDKRTFIEYYLRDDGTVEKSIEYTGLREYAIYKKTYYKGFHGRSLFPDHYTYD
ncbi:MAG: hypothetical protein K6E51_10410 [Treponema sp.]|nr:hypothetical protein [Treponema sp.]